MRRRDAHGPDSRRGWLIAVVGSVAMVFTFGTPLSYGIFISQFATAYDVSRTSLSVVFSLELFAFFAVAGLIGIFGVRLPARLLLIFFGLLTLFLSPLLYVVDSLLGLALVFSLLGTALGTVYVVIVSVVPRWFEQNRGAATGVMFTGIGLSLFVMPTAWELAFTRLGVQFGFFMLTGVSGGAVILAGLICQRPPWVRKSSATFGGLVRWMEDIASTRQFQFLFVGIGMAFAWYYILGAYFIELLVTRGVTETSAVFAFGLIGGVSIISRLAGDIVADQLGYRRTFLISIASASLGSVLLFFPHVPAMIAAVFCLGVALGGVATLHVPILLETYGSENDTAVIGVFNLSFGFFGLMAPPVATALIVRTGTYQSAIWLTLAVTVLALWLTRAGTR